MFAWRRTSSWVNGRKCSSCSRHSTCLTMRTMETISEVTPTHFRSSTISQPLARKDRYRQQTRLLVLHRGSSTPPAPRCRVRSSASSEHALPSKLRQLTERLRPAPQSAGLFFGGRTPGGLTLRPGKTCRVECPSQSTATHTSNRFPYLIRRFMSYRVKLFRLQGVSV